MHLQIIITRCHVLNASSFCRSSCYYNFFVAAVRGTVVVVFFVFATFYRLIIDERAWRGDGSPKDSSKSTRSRSKSESWAGS